MSEASKHMRAVVDTNLLVSGLIAAGGPPAAIIQAARERLFRLVVSAELHREYVRILSSPKLQRYRLAPEIIAELPALFREAGLWVSPISSLSIAICDPKDEMVVATAIDGRADYLVTGDADLLSLRDDPRLGWLRIVSAREFLDLLQSIPSAPAATE